MIPPLFFSRNMDKYISFNQFTFQYDAQAEATLKDISFDIVKGEKVLILGPSGSGKSTLAQCLNGIIPNIHKGQAQGQVRIAGQNIFKQSIYDKSQLVSTVLQDPDGQFIGITVAEDLAFALENDCANQSEMKDKVALWAERLDLTSLLNHRPQDLSGGQKQRVSLAGVLIDESPILLFDEPLANLDPKSGQETIDLIDKIHKEVGATTIIIEHRLEDVLYRPVDRILLVNDGTLLFNGSPDELLSSTLLLENGIREPLYVTVLRQLGFDTRDAQNLSQLDALDLSDLVLPDRVLKDKRDSSSDSILKVEGLSVSYGDNPAIIEDMSFSLKKGERLAIVGKNGAGKSTLAKALCGFVPSQGKLTYKGLDISQDSIAERSERIGFVLQNPNQMISQTMIFDEVALGLRLRGIEETEVEERVHEVLKTCGLYSFRKWPISALSFGQKKRVTIASILVLKPEIIILDEPTAGQDYKTYTDIMNFLDSLQKQGHTIVMITHDMQLMLEYSDRCLVVVEGKIIADDNPVTILNQKELLESANLKQTSLYTLGQKLSSDPVEVTQYYIEKGGPNV
ncbi:Cobalt transport ATP-binding protein cbiO [Streptococcus salivarius K12]|uniref:Cobalt transport ATP-binding protein cbiO n=3 Tax=Streptococcus salivarius TaxID=1304 RepID=J7T627_STRSL|nr:Cobalt transport ATP-binding protein cbiO [Streptococcus salivarius K12]